MCLRCIVFCDGDYLTEGTRDYASSLLGVRSTYHCMGLSAACLAIGEDGAIVTIEHVFHEREGTLLVYITLRGLSWEDAIKREALWLLLRVLFHEIDLVILRIDLNYAYTGWVSEGIPLSRSLEFMGRTRTITFTASAISLLVKNIILFIYCLVSINPPKGPSMSMCGGKEGTR